MSIPVTLGKSLAPPEQRLTETLFFFANPYFVHSHLVTPNASHTRSSDSLTATRRMEGMVKHMDDVVNRHAGMFGEEMVHGWERVLNGFADVKGNRLEALW